MNTKRIFAESLPLINYGNWDIDNRISNIDRGIMDEVGWDVVTMTLYAPWLPPGAGSLVAFDPGYAEAGVCYVGTKTIELWQCNVKAGKQYKYPSATQIAERVHALFTGLDLLASDYVCENAAYAKPFGQANLGLVRGVFAGIALEKVSDLTFLAPQEIKARVHSTTKVDYHKLSKHYSDAVAAFAIALAALKGGK